MSILTKYGYHIIFGVTEETARVIFKDGGFWRRVHNVTDFSIAHRHSETEIWEERSQYAALTLVNQFIALSERSVEHLLRTKWSLQLGTNSEFKLDNFSATFSTTTALRIRLLSSSKMLVIVEIDHAELGPNSRWVKLPSVRIHFSS